jgi:hypothetical protein
MKEEKSTVLVTQSKNSSEDMNLATLPDGYSPVTIILAIAILISAIAKLIQVLVPVMMKDRDLQ